MSQYNAPLSDFIAGVPESPADRNYDPKHDIRRFAKPMSPEQLEALRRKAQGLETATAQPADEKAVVIGRINQLSYTAGIHVELARAIANLESEVRLLHEILQELLQK